MPIAGNGTMEEMEEAEARIFNRNMKPCLDRAHAGIKLHEDRTKENVRVLESVLKEVCEALKLMDQLFCKLYSRFVYTGSYYDNLRIKSADEFDINVVLALPRKSFPPVQLKRSPNSGAFLGCSVEKSKLDEFAAARDWGRSLKKLFSECGEKYWLNMANVRHWFQSLLARLPDLTSVQGVTNIKYTASGPARTICIYTQSGRIDVDLVPVFQTPNNGWPKAMDTDPKVLKFMKSKGINIDKAEWCLVPKEQEPHNDPLYWRLYFPYVERGLMCDNGCLKPTIRLLKLLRDVQGWHCISSYALKTLVIKRTMEEPEGYWDKKNHGITFYQTLVYLQRALLNGGIPYLFSSSVDLLQKVGTDTRTNCAGSLTGILRKVRRDPNHILDYLGLPVETCIATHNMNAAPITSQQDEQDSEQIQPSSVEEDEEEESRFRSRLCHCVVV